MKKRALIFDLDGTIINTIGDIAYAINKTLAKYDFLPQYTTTEIEKMVGYGLSRALISAVPEPYRDNVALLDELTTDLVDIYKQNPATFSAPYPGILELLATLKMQNYKMAVLTNKHDGISQIVVEKLFGHLNCFDYVVGAKEEVPLKPDPTSCKALLTALDVTADEALFIGDSEADFNTAKNANVDILLVDWGFRTRELLLAIAPAEAIASSPDELMKLITSD